ncbi:hypothetical protein [Duganella sp. FT27W]|uniref:hypothetical protein n=1 Tax=Duganella sp. FT27W TaxID=2654636 RepID=UPI00135E3C76|nr:hypothetical protein [Duganella sp. FT27W]MPQ56247.1 hypothetical protein [Duganella sp. FT27W]
MTDDCISIWNDELSDRETFFLGKIIAQWGAMEYEIFHQTLLTFDVEDDGEVKLPAAMNNVQFTGVLDLWRKRVAGVASEARKEVLERQYDRIVKLKVFRDALVHGMLQWSTEDLAEIYSVRVKKKEIIKAKFTTDDLSNFYHQIANVNFKLRFNLDDPDGMADHFVGGGYISRRFLAQMTGHPAADDWLPAQPAPKTNESSDG